MKIKKFIDIEVCRSGNEYLKTNTEAFNPDDHIIVQEKVDGSNASIRWDEEKGEIACFSRRMELTYNNTLNGFYNYVQALPEVVKNYLKLNPNHIIFGEWNLGGNKIKDYSDEYLHKAWIVYDIYDTQIETYLHQYSVQKTCEMLGLTYIHVLYDGKFINWQALDTFRHQNTYGGTQEGFVVKNMTALLNEDRRGPSYLKIVNKEFSEKMNKIKRQPTPEELAARDYCQKVVDEIVTVRRVEKAIEKLRDDGVLPAKLSAEDMKTVAKTVPKEVYQDCLKEEKELVTSAGEKFGKMSGSKTMQICRELILG